MLLYLVLRYCVVEVRGSKIYYSRLREDDFRFLVIFIDKFLYGVYCVEVFKEFILIL